MLVAVLVCLLFVGQANAACSGTTTMNSRSGYIQNPNPWDGTTTYTNSETCYWSITNAEYAPIGLELVQYVSEYNYDKMWIYDGTSASAPLIAFLMGTYTGYTYSSTSYNLYIVWTSDSSVVYTGFKIDWWSQRTATTPGTYASIYNSDYTNNEDYRWKFYSAYAGYWLVSFSSFSSEACCDYMNIYDGSYTNAPVAKAFRGAANDLTPWQSSSSSVFFLWHSDYSVTSTGYSIYAYWYPQLCSSSSPVYAYGTSGYFANPYPYGSNYYSPNSNCYFKAYPYGGTTNRIRYNINQFDFGTGDYLYVYDGYDNTAPLLAVYSSTSSGLGVSGVTATQGNYLTFLFTSDSGYDYRLGFNISWWEGPYCPFPGNPSNGIASMPCPDQNCVLTYTCNLGYLLSGTSTRTCQADSTWSNSAPTCNQIPGYCVTPTTPTNGALVSCQTYVGGQCSFSCNYGYSSAQSLTRTCNGNDQSSGVYSGSPVVCNLIGSYCPALSAPQYGNLGACSQSLGGTCAFSCTTGYGPPPPTRTCQVSGQSTGVWSGSTTVCNSLSGTCTLPSAPDHGSMVSCSTTVGGTCTMACDAGYDQPTPYPVTCSQADTWTSYFNPAASSLCHATDNLCAQLVGPTNGRMNGNCHARSIDDQCTFQCDAGYIINNDCRTCQSNGLWTGATTTCTLDTNFCPTLPPVPAHGFRYNCSQELGGTCSFEGVIGYQCIPAVLTCQSSHLYDSSGASTCLAISGYCNLPTAPLHGAISAGQGCSTTIGGSCYYSCDLGYEPVSGNSRICGNDGNYTLPAMECQRRQCDAFYPYPNGNFSCGSTVFQSSCDFICEPGYQRHGNPTITCGSDGTWSALVATCDLVACPYIYNTVYVNTTCGNDTLRRAVPNEACDLVCNDLSGRNVTVICGSDGAWNGTMTTGCEPQLDAQVQPPANAVVVNGSGYNSGALYGSVGGLGFVIVALAIVFILFYLKKRERRRKVDGTSTIRLGFDAEEMSRKRITAMLEAKTTKDIGAGSAAVVYRAQMDDGSGNWVAIKSLRDKSEQARLEFHREVNIMTRLAGDEHVNVIKIFQFFKDPPSILMELAENGSLHGLVKNKKKLSQELRLTYSRMVAEGMAFLHEHDVVHMDLKLENVLMAANPANPEESLLKITDFGCSLICGIDTEPAMGSMTVVDGFNGTPQYAAPERFKIGQTICLKRGDVFSFGVVAWALYSNKLPYKDTNMETLVSKASQGQLNPVEDFPMPDSMDEAMAKLLPMLLHPDFNQRPHFIEAVVGLGGELPKPASMPTRVFSAANLQSMSAADKSLLSNPVFNSGTGFDSFTGSLANDHSLGSGANIATGEFAAHSAAYHQSNNNARGATPPSDLDSSATFNTVGSIQEMPTVRNSQMPISRAPSMAPGSRNNSNPIAPTMVADDDGASNLGSVSNMGTMNGSGRNQFVPPPNTAPERRQGPSASRLDTIRTESGVPLLPPGGGEPRRTTPANSALETHRDSSSLPPGGGQARRPTPANSALETRRDSDMIANGPSHGPPPPRRESPSPSAAETVRPDPSGAAPMAFTTSPTPGAKPAPVARPPRSNANSTANGMPPMKEETPPEPDFPPPPEEAPAPAPVAPTPAAKPPRSNTPSSSSAPPPELVVKPPRPSAGSNAPPPQPVEPPAPAPKPVVEPPSPAPKPPRSNTPSSSSAPPPEPAVVTPPAPAPKPPRSNTPSSSNAPPPEPAVVQAPAPAPKPARTAYGSNAPAPEPTVVTPPAPAPKPPRSGASSNAPEPDASVVAGGPPAPAAKPPRTSTPGAVPGGAYPTKPSRPGADSDAPAPEFGSFSSKNPPPRPPKNT